MKPLSNSHINNIRTPIKEDNSIILHTIIYNLAFLLLWIHAYKNKLSFGCAAMNKFGPNNVYYIYIRYI